MSTHPVTNLHVRAFEPLVTPGELRGELPISEVVAERVEGWRREVSEVLNGRDPRLLVVVGPCSIHDPRAALEYAERLDAVRSRLGGELLIVMRVYFEKPRTTVGWKGFINDPGLDGSCDVARGLRSARSLLLDLAERGTPAAGEMLDPIVPQYLAGLFCWSAIGARTTESQTHREMASGLSMPVGFKNGTDGSLDVAINGMKAARSAHSFLGIDDAGRVSVVRTAGNPDCHAVLRGGTAGPNYGRYQVAAAADALVAAGLNPRVLVDCSHANSNKRPENQPQIAADVAERVAADTQPVLGVMLESHLVAGRQDLGDDAGKLVYGQSLTDACIDFETTERVLEGLAEASARRRSK